MIEISDEVLKQEKEEREEQKKSVQSILIRSLYILLNRSGGVEIEKKVYRQMPDNWLDNLMLTDDGDHFKIFVKKKRKRGIIKPRRELFIPGG